jgi:ubiquitin carboxyl-terminal hydrolase 48
VTVEDLQVFANETLDLREANEIHELDSDLDEQPAKKRRRETERGFGGTLLSGGVSDQEESGRNRSSDSREDTPHGFSSVSSERACTACTLLNAYDAVACKVCNTLFV